MGIIPLSGGYMVHFEANYCVAWSKEFTLYFNFTKQHCQRFINMNRIRTAVYWLRNMSFFHVCFLKISLFLIFEY